MPPAASALFPFKRKRCACEWQLARTRPPPAKTTFSASYFLMGDRFSEDPFSCSSRCGAQPQSRLLADLAVQRRKLLVSRAASAKAAAKTAAKAERQAEAKGRFSKAGGKGQAPAPVPAEPARRPRRSHRFMPITDRRPVVVRTRCPSIRICRDHPRRWRRNGPG